MGRGVFATKKIKKGTVIHQAYFIKAKDEEVSLCPDVDRYTFIYNKKYSALCLGIGSLINHSDEPNAEICFTRLNGIEIMEFSTIKKILPGEQVFINYGGNEYAYRHMVKKEKL